MKQKLSKKFKFIVSTAFLLFFASFGVVIVPQVTLAQQQPDQTPATPAATPDQTPAKPDETPVKPDQPPATPAATP
ncbi:MAG: hypothetical protein V7K86_08470, partial [Nostoc sp.]